jgi:hypothetical protein
MSAIHNKSILHRLDFTDTAPVEDDAEPARAAAVVQPVEEQPAAAKSRRNKPPPSVEARKSLKFIGGYFDTDDVEKIAILRARLKLDNSRLFRRAIHELYAKNKARRAFGDAE